MGDAVLIRLLAIAAPLLLAGCDLPPLSSEDVFGLSPHPRAWISGLVTDARTGAPLERASVLVYDSAAASDSRGAYRLDGLTAGAFSGSASRAGYQPTAFSVALRPGGNHVDLTLVPLPCGGCGPGQACDVGSARCVEEAVLTGITVSACTGKALSARVTFDGQSTCSTASKGYFRLEGLRPGGPSTLAIGKQGYLPLSEEKTVSSGSNTTGSLMLTPIAGCDPRPADVACTCSTPNCQQ
jgi:hypothetical protein